MDLPTRPDDGTASERLFKKLFRVKAPRSLTMTEEEIKLYGQRVTGIKQLDKYLANEWITGRVNIPTMARIVSMGGGIQFCNKFDTKEIYLLISQHFVNWEHILDNEYNVTPPPKEDFDTLKYFLDALEVFAGFFDREDPNRNPLGEMSVLSGRSLRRKFRPTRVAIGGLKPARNNDVIVEEIRSFEDLQNIDRSR